MTRVSAVVTVWPPARVALLSLKLPSVLMYLAVTAWLPTARDDVASVATPLASSGTGLPAGVPSIENWTVPVGVPLVVRSGLTVAVKVTESPSFDGSSLDWSDVVVSTATLATWVVAWADVGVGWTLPALSVATL